MFTIVLTKRARKECDKLPKEFRSRVERAIDSLALTPFAGKKLEGEWGGYWALRSWPYRIIYVIQKEIVTVTVIHIDHRQGVYKGLR